MRSVRQLYRACGVARILLRVLARVAEQVGLMQRALGPGVRVEEWGVVPVLESGAVRVLDDTKWGQPRVLLVVQVLQGTYVSTGFLKHKTRSPVASPLGSARVQWTWGCVGGMYREVPATSQAPQRDNFFRP